MTFPGHIGPTPNSDHYYFTYWGGRLMAMVLLAVLSSYSLTSSRDEAKDKLSTFTPEVHAAGFSTAHAKLVSDAENTDGFLAVVAIIIAG